ncbi:hypothetical protein D3C77_466060 [compost metagenome]
MSDPNVKNHQKKAACAIKAVHVHNAVGAPAVSHLAHPHELFPAIGPFHGDLAYSIVPLLAASHQLTAYDLQASVNSQMPVS